MFSFVYFSLFCQIFKVTCYPIQSQRLKDLDLSGNKALWTSVSGLGWMNRGSEFMVDATWPIGSCTRLPLENMMVYDPTNHSYVITFAVPQLLKVKCNDNVIRAAKVEISGLQGVERIGRSPERVAGSVYREGCKQPVCHFQPATLLKNWPT